MSAAVLAIDPGRDKCGLALLDSTGAILKMQIVESSRLVDTVVDWTSRLVDTVVDWTSTLESTTVVMGSGTGSKSLRKELAERIGPDRLIIVDEFGSTEMAKILYFKANPPRGIWRFIPISLQVPPRAVDDYAAAVLGRKFLGIRWDM